MSNSIMLYPSLDDELISRIRFQPKKYEFYYTDKNDDEYDLVNEPIEAASSVYIIKDEKGVWTQDNNNLCFRRKYCLRTFQCLFGENGVACTNASLGIGIQWTSLDSRQRGVIPISVFDASDTILEIEAEKKFGKAQLRGEVCFSTILYIAKAGTPTENEHHLANTEGYILGELDTFTIKLDGSGSSFPIYEISDPGQPLWYIQCNWIDPTAEKLSECVSIIFNTAHKNYSYLNREDKNFDCQLLSEIMASAITLLIEKVRLEPGYWDQIMQGEDLETGSVGHVIYYFMKTLEWDLSTPETTSLSARKHFDQRIK
ncbi:hypothetical protein SAMN02745247_02828 [Butyrivibrio hungatei DSM 14810]|uniref:Uncharacterized protein n=1 Tax=Butyrivibrio hungatei DSM 14810 TaxID=1121132 RepID=A0A1M7T1L8_9FIRM|nr:hypothetical protein [Butyrivibrio hungatei]SHN64626.1 hypothetical protein SAMN02745247_02828 [Butyrivibrio hungatei DSM 14810]